MADCLISSVQVIGKCVLIPYVWPALKPHVDYWWYFDTNILGLREEVGHLNQQISCLKQNIEKARFGAETPARVVELLNLASETLVEGERILDDVNIPAWKITDRYSMGKRVKKTAETIANLRNHRNFNTAPTMEFESRKSIEKGIVDCLKESTVGMIVICGMGGVGKTTMAKRIKERVKEENLFDEVVIVTVSQTIDIPKIQNEIAELLGLKFDVESISARAPTLRTRLMDSQRKIIIFDDVWDSFKYKDLETLGIPIETNYEKCKVILTSRDANACQEIENKKVFKLKILEADEAWFLFKDKAGNCVDSISLNLVAKEVVAECKGLPIALVTVGVALNDKTIGRWDTALSQLRKANLEDFSNVYNPLKLSYDFLDSDRERYIFLLCCLFPEDFNISVEQLTWYSMGLELFHDVDNVKEARNRTHTLVEKLQSRFLLIDLEKEGKKGLEVKMHDVIRDVAIYIGSIEKDGFLKSLNSKKNPRDVNCNWMSVEFSNEQMEVPVLSRFPKLRLLMLLKLSHNQFSDISFEGMKDLNVLSFESTSIPSLPPTLELLENLHTLRLFRCSVENISVIGKLTSLKILSCCECGNIRKLPKEIGSLKDLRLLELSDCWLLRTIPSGVISSLSLLEVLKIRFSKWETRGNASLTELDGLGNLTCFEIKTSYGTLYLSQKLVRYTIFNNVGDNSFRISGHEKVMNLGGVGNWIQQLARKAESLMLRKDDSHDINQEEMENLSHLIFRDCSKVKKLVDTSHLNQNVLLNNLEFISIRRCSNLRYLFPVSVARTILLQLEVLLIENCVSMEQVFWDEIKNNNNDGCIEFPKLKELTLESLPNLTAFCHGLNINSKVDSSFSNLKSIKIIRCNNLKSLFSARSCLLQLEVLEIKACEAMEQVFWNKGIDDCIEFPKLKELSLQNLPNLTAFCQGLENIIIKFPNLTEMKIEGLPKLNSIFPHNSKVDSSFSNLKSIKIIRCNNLRSLFSARSCLLQLEVLEITHCEAMEQVFWNNGTDDFIEFPKLKELSLENLLNLTAFCQGLENIVINFPNLTEMKIRRLPKLNSLFPCFHLFCNPKDVSFCNLISIYIENCDNLRYLFSVSAAGRCLLHLEFLKIDGCKAMEQVFWNEGTDDNTDGCIEFPKLKELYLYDLPNLTAFCQGLENIIIKFPNLTKMDIGGLPKLNSLSPLNSETHENTCFHLFCDPKDLPQLEFLQIEDCVAMEQVFWNEIKDNNTDGCIEFPKLEELILWKLPNLTAFCKGLENITIKFPNLTKMDIGGLPKLNSLSPLNSETVVRHDKNTCFHFVCNPKVEMGLLKFLRLSNFEDNIKNIWCSQIPNNVFNNLERLRIAYMNGIRSLMSTSIAKKLVSLKYLHIIYCEEMVEVIENDDDDNDKQVVDINGWFPNLKSLIIGSMPKLRRFWQWNHALELTLLEEMKINDCPAMETFTLGSVNTPNIRNIYVNSENTVVHKDLNDVISNIWIRRWRDLHQRLE